MIVSSIDGSFIVRSVLTWVGSIGVTNVPHECLHGCLVGLSVGHIQMSQCGCG